MLGVQRSIPAFFRRRYQTPAQSPTGTICRALHIPNDVVFLAAVDEALSFLLNEDAWFSDGGQSVEDAVELLDLMYTDYLVSECASPMAGYEVIEPKTAWSVAGFTIDNIPPDFEVLRLTYRARTSAAVQIRDTRIYLNNDTTPANYRSYSKGFFAGGGAAETVNNGVLGGIEFHGGATGASSPAGAYAIWQITLPNYKATTENKIVIAEGHGRFTTLNTGFRPLIASGEWLNETDPVTQIDFRSDTVESFASGGWFMLEGLVGA